MGNSPQEPEHVQEIVENTKEIYLIIVSYQKNSGRSAIFNQILRGNGGEFPTKNQQKIFMKCIHQKIITSTFSIFKACLSSNEPFEDSENNKRGTMLFSDEFNEEMYNIVVELWKEPSMMKQLNERLEEFVNLQYYLERLEKMKPPHYVPSVDDILHCKCISLRKSQFMFNNQKFNIFNHVNVPNSRNQTLLSGELSKMNRIIYVASLIEYDTLDYKNENSMLSNLKLFGELINYYNCDFVVLFLNKVDLFKKKILKKDLTCTFPEYKGGNDVEAGIEFIKKKYRETVNKNPENLQIYVVCAMNEDSVINAFNDAHKSPISLKK
jgi:hypothetical protein